MVMINEKIVFIFIYYWIYQYFTITNLTSISCMCHKIYTPNHSFLENNIAIKAFMPQTALICCILLKAKFQKETEFIIIYNYFFLFRLNQRIEWILQFSYQLILALLRHSQLRTVPNLTTTGSLVRRRSVKSPQ